MQIHENRTMLQERFLRRHVIRQFPHLDEIDLSYTICVIHGDQSGTNHESSLIFFLDSFLKSLFIRYSLGIRKNVRPCTDSRAHGVCALIFAPRSHRTQSLT